MFGASNSLLIEGCIEDKRVNIVIDTDAFRTIVSPRVVSPWRIKRTSTNFEEVTATGERSGINGEVDRRIKLGSQEVVHKHWFLI